MKNMHKRLFPKLAVAVLLLTGSALAGSSSSTEVSVWTSGGKVLAKGSLRVARYSSDTTQYIGCSRYAYDTGSNSITCYALEENGDYANCYTGDENMLRVAETLNRAAYLYFRVDTDGSCDFVITTLASYNL